MKLEIGAGHRPTPGYVATDINPFDEIVQVCPAWQIDGINVDEVLALGVIEHLTFAQVAWTFAHVKRLLLPGGVFLFDVPDLPVWCGYLTGESPFPRDHVLKTIYGWQRWPGDEHKSGWDAETLTAELHGAGFESVRFGLEPFEARGLWRRRFGRPEDAHLYVEAK